LGFIKNINYRPYAGVKLRGSSPLLCLKLETIKSRFTTEVASQIVLDGEQV